MGRYTESDRLTVRGRARDARTMTRADVVSPGVAGETTYPRFTNRAAGAYIWDVDGNRYIDFLLGYGPVVLGHADTRVDQAAIHEIRNGISFAPLWSPRQVELAELLSAVVPGAECSLLLKTGSDATSAAVRLARIFTARSKIVRWGYNGWHDWSVEQPAGIPPSVRAETSVLSRPDPNDLETILRAHPEDVACVIMMPFENEVVAASDLSRIQDLCRSHGALFVLDELRSGFRLALGGAQSFFGVSADLVALGKAMANGYTISALTGRRDILECLGETKISSTFFANPADMAAALVTISTLSETDSLERIWRSGTLLQEGLRSVFAGSDVECVVMGYPPMPFIEFREVGTARGIADEFAQLFYTLTTHNGLLFHPHHQWFLSASHTDADIEYAVQACRRAASMALDATARSRSGRSKYERS